MLVVMMYDDNPTDEYVHARHAFFDYLVFRDRGVMYIKTSPEESVVPGVETLEKTVGEKHPATIGSITVDVAPNGDGKRILPLEEVTGWAVPNSEVFGDWLTKEYPSQVQNAPKLPIE